MHVMSVQYGTGLNMVIVAIGPRISIVKKGDIEKLTSLKVNIEERSLTGFSNFSYLVKKVV